MIDRVHLCGGSVAFRKFLGKLCGERLKRFDLAAGMPDCEADENTIYILLPQYDNNIISIPPAPLEQVMLLGEYKRLGARIYIENYPCRDYLTREVFGCFLTGRARHVWQENLVVDETILQADNLLYFPRAQPNDPSVKVLATVEDCVGLHQRLRDGRVQFPVLTDDGEGCFAASMNLTACEPLYLRPRHAWKEFFCRLWSQLLEAPRSAVEAAFEFAWPSVMVCRGGSDALEGVRAAVKWHLESGLLPAHDGSRGCYEMIRSDDLEFRANLRTDSILMSAAFLTGAGSHCQQESWCQIGRRLADFILDRDVQDAAGFIRWYENLPRVYSNDLGRHGLALHYLWKTTGNERYRECAERLARAALAWLARDGVCSGTFDTREGYANAGGVPSPVFHAEMAAFLLRMNTSECLAAVRRMLDCMDLNSQAIGHSRPDAWSRALLAYSCAHQMVRDCSVELATMLDYFEDHQAPCGGLWEDDLFLRRSAPLEAGVAQGGGHDHIADQLYCNNYVFAALSVLRRKSAETRVEKMYQRLRAFLLDIQIASPDARFDGAWMRAFDLDCGEYYGLTLDRDWGPYCIMAGWTMGIIPLTLLADAGGVPFFD